MISFFDFLGQLQNANISLNSRSGYNGESGSTNAMSEADIEALKISLEIKTKDHADIDYAYRDVIYVQYQHFEKARDGQEQISFSDVKRAIGEIIEKCEIQEVVENGYFQLESYLIFSDYICAFAVDHDVEFTPFCRNDLDSEAINFPDLANRFDEDPYLDPDVYSDEQFGVKFFSVECLTNILKDVHLSSDDMPEDAHAIVVFPSTDEDQKIEVEDESNGTIEYESARDHALFSHILDCFAPVGNSWEYNDGVQGRLSGYYNCPDPLYVEVNAAPASAILNVARKLANRSVKDESRKRILKFLEKTKAPEKLIALCKSQHEVLAAP